MPTVPNPIESGIGALWYAKQTAGGTYAPTAQAGTVRLRLREGGFKANKTNDEEEYVDGEAFSNASQFVRNIGGEVGDATFQGQIETSGLMLAQVLAVDTVTGTTPDYTHTITSAGLTAPFGTWRQKTGSAVGPQREAYWDSKLGKLVWNCGQDQFISHLTPTVLALQPATPFTTDPTAADSGTDPFNWSEADGFVTIDATSYAEIAGETLEIERQYEPFKGQGIRPIALIPSKGGIMRSFSAIVTDQTLPLYRSILWNTATPADDLLPTNTVKYMALESTYTRSSVRSLKITTPRVAIKADDIETHPLAEGGKKEIVFGGKCLKNGATAACTVVAKTGDASAYV